ncbi:hypothetical protein M5D96_005513 [Drosophila gunungcola]|uniref:Secreted protein n=1 Tax=Drosophila gunungcola TaxID=103775 RepID=A0A9Q0BQV5_9MUSC|nr:hypothetical protein M5D96_005513 [Drosophila gunungcola]
MGNAHFTSLVVVAVVLLVLVDERLEGSRTNAQRAQDTHSGNGLRRESTVDDAVSHTDHPLSRESKVLDLGSRNLDRIWMRIGIGAQSIPPAIAVSTPVAIPQLPIMPQQQPIRSYSNHSILKHTIQYQYQYQYPILKTRQTLQVASCNYRGSFAVDRCLQHSPLTPTGVQKVGFPNEGSGEGGG